MPNTHSHTDPCTHNKHTATHVEVHERHFGLAVLGLLVLGGGCLRPLAPSFQPLERKERFIYLFIYGI